MSTSDSAALVCVKCGHSRTVGADGNAQTQSFPAYVCPQCEFPAAQNVVEEEDSGDEAKPSLTNPLSGKDNSLRVALVRAAIPYEALLLDAESRKWIAPEIWSDIESAVLAIREVIAPTQPPATVAVVDEVQRRMDAVVDAAVEWHTDTDNEGWPENADKLADAIESLLELRNATTQVTVSPEVDIHLVDTEAGPGFHSNEVSGVSVDKNSE